MTATSPIDNPVRYSCSYLLVDADGNSTKVFANELNARCREDFRIDYDVLTVTDDGQVTVQPILLNRDIASGHVAKIRVSADDYEGAIDTDFIVITSDMRPVIESVTPSVNMIEVGCEPLVLDVNWRIPNPALSKATVTWEWKYETDTKWKDLNLLDYNCNHDYTIEDSRLVLSASLVAPRPKGKPMCLRATVASVAAPELTASVEFKWRRVADNDFTFSHQFETMPDGEVLGFVTRVTPNDPSAEVELVVVPCMLGSLKPQALKSGLFEGCTWMKECWLPHSIKVIESSAFAGCTGLRNVYGMENVAEIRPDTFSGCSSLESVAFGEGLRSIDAGAFAGCGGLRQLTFAGNAPAVEDGAFDGASTGAVVYVQYGTTGWDGTPGSTAIPATWQGLRVRYRYPESTDLVPKAVLCDNGATLRFVCDGEAYGVRGKDWFDVKEAERARSEYDIPWRDVAGGVRAVVFEPSFAGCRPESTAWWFCGFDGLQSVTGLKHLDVSEVKSMKQMFYSCASLVDLDLTTFETETVTNMEDMFRYCSGLVRIHASASFATDAVTASDRMFYGCESIVGGNDTRYNAGYVDKTWARVGELYTNGYFTAELSVPKAVREDDGKTLRFVYDGVSHGTKGTDWFDVSAAESLYSDPPWCSAKITRVVFDASFAEYAPVGMARWFHGFNGLVEIKGLENLDTSRVVNMDFLFSRCSALKTVDLHRLNLAQVTSAIAMFSGCLQLRTVSVGPDQAFAPSASTNMFTNCFRLVGENGTACDGISRTDATYARRDLPGEPGYFSLFREAYAVWDAQTTTLKFRFDGDFSEGNPVFRRWDDIVFAETEWINWSNWRQAELCTACTRVVFEPSMRDFKPTSCRCLFSQLSAVTEVSGLKWLDTHAVTDMSRMFETCNALTDVPFEGFDTSSVTNMSSMFAYCNHVEKLDVGSFDASHVADMSYMFNGCTRLAEIDATYLFTVDAVTKSTDMFSSCRELKGGRGTAYDSTKVDKTRACLDVPGRSGYLTAACVPYARLTVTSANRVLTFRYDDNNGNKPTYHLTNGFCHAELDWRLFAATPPYKVVFEPSITNWHPTSCERLFWNLSQVSNITGLAYLDTSLCTNMTSMFSGMKAMKSFDVTALDTSRVRNMSHMFDKCSAATNVVLRGLDTSSATDMNRMFMECDALKSVDFSGVSTRSVDNMSSMFYSCSKLEILDLSGFDTSCVTNMSGMFSRCGSLATIYVSEDFVADRVGNSSSMFYNCTKLVGGAGTAFDSNFVTATRACVDNPPDAPGYFTLKAEVPPLSGYAAWAAEKGLSGANAAWDAKPALWGGKWANAFIYTYGEGLADGALVLLDITFDRNNRPVILTAPEIEGRADFTSSVIGTKDVRDWSSPVLLKRNGDDAWTLPLGESANFFRILLNE